MPKPKPAKAPKPLKAKPATPINVKPYEPEAPGARKWRNRIVGHDEVDATSLLANPKNWRIHPKNQVDALAGVLAEVGWVQEVIVNKASGFVVDVHARVSLAIKAGEKVPVVYVNRARWDLPFGRLHDVGESRALGPSDQFQDFGALTLGAETAGIATPGLAALLLALASFFVAGIFYCPVACEKIPGLRQIPMEWWEQTKPVANRFHPT